MTRYTHRRVMQARRSAAYPSNKREMLKDFDILSKILLTAGLAIPSLDDDKKPKPRRLCTKLFETAVNMLALFVMVVNIFFWQRRYSSLTLHFSTSLTIFFALSVRFVLYLSRGKVPDMVRNLVRLYDDVTGRSRPYSSLRRPVLAGCATTFFLTAVASILDGYRIHLDRERGENIILFLVKFNDTDGTYQMGMCRLFLFLVPIKMYFAYGVSVMILIFCSSVYIVTKRTVLAFLDHIEEQGRSRAVLTTSVLSAYLGYYNRISRSVAEIDDVLSPCVLLLYGLMISGQFYTLTVLIAKDSTERASFTTGLHNSIVFLLTTAAFLVVTLTASKVTEASEDIRRSLQKLSERISGSEEVVFSGGGSVGAAYLVLVSVLNGSHLSFTGWKMFNINRSLILTTMGVMISYGVIIVQIGRKYDALERHSEL